MNHTRLNQGVCSRSTTVTLNEDGIITDIQVESGCDGNLKGICSLLIGQKAEDAIPRMKGITCGRRSSSCPDQIAFCLEEAIAKNK